MVGCLASTVSLGQTSSQAVCAPILSYRLGCRRGRPAQEGLCWPPRHRDPGRSPVRPTTPTRANSDPVVPLSPGDHQGQRFDIIPDPYFGVWLHLEWVFSSLFFSNWNFPCCKFTIGSPRFTLICNMKHMENLLLASSQKEYVVINSFMYLSLSLKWVSKLHLAVAISHYMQATHFMTMRPWTQHHFTRLQMCSAGPTELGPLPVTPAVVPHFCSSVTVTLRMLFNLGAGKTATFFFK